MPRLDHITLPSLISIFLHVCCTLWFSLCRPRLDHSISTKMLFKTADLVDLLVYFNNVCRASHINKCFNKIRRDWHLFCWNAYIKCISEASSTLLSSSAMSFSPVFPPSDLQSRPFLFITGSVRFGLIYTGILLHAHLIRHSHVMWIASQDRNGFLIFFSF